MNTRKCASDFFEEIDGLLEISQVIRDLRKAEGLTQLALANIIGVPKQDISDIENSRKPCGIKKAIRLAKALNSSEIILVELSLKQMITREGLNYNISLEKIS